MNNVRIWHDRRVSELAEDYRKAGYNVVVEPRPQQLPFPLGNFVPDLVAEKGGAGAIVEVRSNPSQVSVETLLQVADIVRGRPGWRFLLVTGEDVDTGVLPGDDEPPSWDEIDRRVERGTRMSANDAEAGFLLLWIAFEGMLRRRARELSFAVDRLQPYAVMAPLNSAEELSDEHLREAEELLRIRNRIVHGLATSEVRHAGERLRRLIDAVRSDWGSSVTAA